MEKPSKLDWIVAVTPVPYFGEKSAFKVASYVASGTDNPTTDIEKTNSSYIFWLSRFVGYMSLFPLSLGLNNIIKYLN